MKCRKIPSCIFWPGDKDPDKLANEVIEDLVRRKIL